MSRKPAKTMKWISRSRNKGNMKELSDNCDLDTTSVGTPKRLAFSKAGASDLLDTTKAIFTTSLPAK